MYLYLVVCVYIQRRPKHLTKPGKLKIWIHRTIIVLLSGFQHLWPGSF